MRAGSAEQTLGHNELWGDDWPAARALWRLDPAVAHLNHGSFGAAPIPVLEAQDEWRRRAQANPTGFYSRKLTGLLDGVRERVAALAGADTGGLVLLPNVTMAMAAVLASAGLGAGDEVLITDHTYAGVRAAIDAACEAAGARVCEVTLPLDILPHPEQVLAALIASVTPRTRLAVIDHITSPTGALLEVRTLVAGLHERGVPVAVDGAHAPGAVPLDVAAIDADFYLGNLHKWCCAPPGAGFVAVAANRRAKFRPAVPGSRAELGFPAAVEWWGTADYSALLSAPAAFDVLEGLGTERVREHGRRLAARGQGELAAALGTEAPRLDHGPMTVVPLPPGVACTTAEARRLRAVIAARLGAEVMLVPHARRGYLRLSAHVYNRPAEYSRLAADLPDLLREDAAASRSRWRRSDRLSG